MEKSAATYAGRVTAPRIAGVQPYPFFPQGGTLWQDLFVGNFVDLDPSSGILDFDCTNFTYDGHKGYDSGIDSFAKQAIGIPVFAALDGTVVATHDGEPDMNTVAQGQPSNYVTINHGNGQLTLYFHLKKNSVAVSAGQFVTKGTQIGQTASSGNSTGPHLHFESQLNGTPYEPSSGPCRPGASNWVSQTPIRRDVYARDPVLSPNDFSGNAGLPWDQPVRTGTFVAGPRSVYFRVQLGNISANSAWKVRFKRPDATIAFEFDDTFQQEFRNGWAWWGAGWNFDVTGTWNIVLDINGGTVATVPFAIVADAGQIVNRPPNAIGLNFDPLQPGAADAIFCRVQTSLTAQDPDYDLVRYHYVWTFNGSPVRDVVSAGLADAIPARGSSGGTVGCSVTPSDGTTSGPTASKSVIVGGTTAVRVRSFSISRERAGARLRWTTASEAAIVGFVLSRQVAPRKPWTQMARLAARHPGQSSGSSYSFVDKTASSGDTYLLRFVRTDGQLARVGQVSLP